EGARELGRRQPAGFRDSLFPGGAHFAAAAHDIGKISPTFVEKLRRACDPAVCTLQPLPVNPQLESTWGGHAGVSQLTARALAAPEFVPEILGQHHGFSPSLGGLRADDEQFGGVAWQAERIRQVDSLMQALQDDWPQVRGLAQAQVVAGLTSAAGWIGSGQEFEDTDLPCQR